MFIYVRTLVMVRKYDRALSKSGFGLDNTLLAILVLQRVETFKVNGFCLHDCSVIPSKDEQIYDKNSNQGFASSSRFRFV